MSSTPVRFDADLFSSARASGKLHSRSAAQQLAHWARIGRELEASTSVSVRDIESVLAGDSAYDDLREREQAVVRGAWDEQVAARLANLDLAATHEAAGQSWAEADDDGVVTVHPAG